LIFVCFVFPSKQDASIIKMNEKSKTGLIIYLLVLFGVHCILNNYNAEIFFLSLFLMGRSEPYCDQPNSTTIFLEIISSQDTPSMLIVYYYTISILIKYVLLVYYVTLKTHFNTQEAPKIHLIIVRTISILHY
jgi:hypothetical protein